MSRQLNIPFFGTPPDEYEAAYFSELTRSFAVFAQQVNTPGPWRATELTLTQQTGNVDYGQLSWNIDSETIDITMGENVVQQVGFETYMRCKNDTGSQINNGQVVGFAGVNAEIKVAPYIADSSSNELYFVGVATRDTPDQDVAPVTLYGKVRGLDTTGPGAETWNVGDILYASPTTAGLMTNIRPTAPNAVIVVAAVLSVDATDGEIMVRPTVPIGMDYGSFDSTSTQTISTINTATSITLGTTLSSNGVTIGTPTSRIVVSQAGFYSLSASLQLTSSSSSAKMVYFWLRKNGVDVPDTVRAITVNINGGETPISLSYTVSLAASDYVELYWAADSTDVSLNALTGLAFAPDAPSVLVNISQLQL